MVSSEKLPHVGCRVKYSCFVSDPVSLFMLSKSEREAPGRARSLICSSKEGKYSFDAVYLVGASTRQPISSEVALAAVIRLH